jgi:hypothetical protein
MKREIICTSCFKTASYLYEKHPGEHVKTAIGNLRAEAICDTCGHELAANAAVACVSMWNDELESRGRGYYVWEPDYIYPVNPAFIKILTDQLSQPGRRNMEISKEILDQAVSMVNNQLEQYRDTINQAFMSNDEILEIGSKIRLSFAKGKFKIQTKLTFVESKIKDDQTVWYDPDQMQLFTEESEGTESVDL